MFSELQLYNRAKLLPNCNRFFYIYVRRCDPSILGGRLPRRAPLPSCCCKSIPFQLQRTAGWSPPRRAPLPSCCCKSIPFQLLAGVAPMTGQPITGGEKLAASKGYAAKYQPYSDYDSQLSRAMRVSMAMGGSGAAAARALRAATDTAAAGTSRGLDSQDIASWYATMKSPAAATPTLKPTAATLKPVGEGSICLLDLPEDVLLTLLALVGSPLLPGSAVGLATCCKAMRRMPVLRKASTAFKSQHKAAVALSARCGTTTARMGSVECARLAWSAKGLQCADMRLLAGLGRFMPRLSELDMRFNKIGDDGLMALARASAKGWLPELTVLGLSNNCITTGGAKALASVAAGSPPAFVALEQLLLNFNAIEGEGMAALALAMGDGALPRLVSFALDGNKGDNDIVSRRCWSPRKRVWPLPSVRGATHGSMLEVQRSTL